MLLEITEKIVGENAFEQKKKKPGLNLTLGLGGNRRSNYWAQVYKWVPGTYCRGQHYDGPASLPGGVAILPGMLHAKETGISCRRLGLLYLERVVLSAHSRSFSKRIPHPELLSSLSRISFLSKSHIPCPLNFSQSHFPGSSQIPYP